MYEQFHHVYSFISSAVDQIIIIGSILLFVISKGKIVVLSSGLIRKGRLKLRKSKRIIVCVHVCVVNKL